MDYRLSFPGELSPQLRSLRKARNLSPGVHMRVQTGAKAVNVGYRAQVQAGRVCLSSTGAVGMQALLHHAQIAPGFKLNDQSAQDWVHNEFRRPGREKKQLILLVRLHAIAPKQTVQTHHLQRK